MESGSRETGRRAKGDAVHTFEETSKVGELAVDGSGEHVRVEQLSDSAAGGMAGDEEAGGASMGIVGQESAQPFGDRLDHTFGDAEKALCDEVSGEILVGYGNGGCLQHDIDFQDRRGSLQETKELDGNSLPSL